MIALEKGIDVSLLKVPDPIIREELTLRMSVATDAIKNGSARIDVLVEELTELKTLKIEYYVVGDYRTALQKRREELDKLESKEIFQGTYDHM